MKTKIMTYLVILLSLITLDGMWLGILAMEDYQKAMGYILRERVIVWPWIAFYVSYHLAILVWLSRCNCPQSLGISSYGGGWF